MNLFKEIDGGIRSIGYLAQTIEIPREEEHAVRAVPRFVPSCTQYNYSIVILPTCNFFTLFQRKQEALERFHLHAKALAIHILTLFGITI